MKMILPYIEPVISALPFSALFLFLLFVSARLLMSECVAKLSKWNRSQVKVFRREIGKTFLEASVALCAAWYIGATTINRVGALFALMDDNNFLSPDLWVFVGGVLSTGILAIHGCILALECMFKSSGSFVSDFSSGRAWRPLTGVVFTLIDYIRGVARILNHALWCLLKPGH